VPIEFTFQAQEVQFVIIDGSIALPHDAQTTGTSNGCLFSDKSLRAKLGRFGAGTVRRKYQFEAFRCALRKILGEFDSRLAEA
jgi:hypothetical protein